MRLTLAPAVIVVIVYLTSFLCPPTMVLESARLDSALDAIGAYIALNLAVLLYLVRNYYDGETFVLHTWASAGVGGVGILKLASSITEDMNYVLWAHIAERFIGGICFLCAVIPGQKPNSKALRSIPLLSVAFSLVLSFALLGMEGIPAFEGTQLLPLVKILNPIAGALFLASAYLWSRKPEIRISYLAWIYSLFPFYASAAFFYPFTYLWGPRWWLTQLLELMPFFIALYEKIRVYSTVQGQLQKTKQALLDSNRKLEGIVENVLDVFWMTSPDFQKLEYVSSSYERVWGYPSEVIYKRPLHWLECIIEEDRSRIEEAIRSTSAAKFDRFDREYRIRKPNGEIRWIHDRGFPVRDAYGSIAHIAGVATDITDRKHTEEQLRLAHQNLEEQRNALLQSNSDLQYFAYLASHDLQEPLRMIKSFLTLLESRSVDKLDDTSKEFLSFARDGAKRMTERVNKLLFYAKLKQQSATSEEVSMQRILEQVKLDLAESIGTSGLNIQHDDLPIVKGDATQLTQLVQNLVSNAIKYRGTDPPLLKIQTRRNGDKWQFSFSDNGIGIEPASCTRLFEMFSRVSNEDYRGTGLGLAICKRIVERHKGEIWIESEVKRGTTIHFTLSMIAG